MFVKYRKSNSQRLLFIDNTLMIEENNTIIAIGRKDEELSTEKTIFFSIAVLGTTDKEMAKRFVRSALNYQNDKRRIFYNVLVEDSLNYKPKLTFSHE